MPFGLKNAPSEFSRIMNHVLGILTCVQIYLDDIIVHSHSFEQHLMEDIELVLNTLKNVNLKINLKKNRFLMKEIKVLGHVIRNGKIKTDKEKVLPIQERLPLNNIKR
jgi:hypothetical protein